VPAHWAGSDGDADLVWRARDGDRDAFVLLVRHHQGMVLRVIERLTGSPTMAADASQEAAVAALVGLDRLRSPERFGAWYVGIALNIARRWLRQPVAAMLIDDHADLGPTPEDQVVAAELAAAVRDAVAVLAPGQRQAVLAFYWQGLTHAEVAAELAISPSAVKARLHQARTTLNSRLAPSIRTALEVMPVPATAEPVFVDAHIVEVRRSDGDDPTWRPHVVVLEETAGARRLPIYIGSPEATALAYNLESVEMPRPMTYQLSAGLLAASGARVNEVRITHLAEGNFYAAVLIDGPSGPAEVDARPSDALNLAIVCSAPIRVDNALLDDPEAIRHTAWENFPTGVQELATEVRQRHEELRTRRAEFLRASEQDTGP
jgi:RNA polymerase sigma factor (sigma-70 family)